MLVFVCASVCVCIVMGATAHLKSSMPHLTGRSPRGEPYDVMKLGQGMESGALEKERNSDNMAVTSMNSHVLAKDGDMTVMEGILNLAQSHKVA